MVSKNAEVAKPQQAEMQAYTELPREVISALNTFEDVQNFFESQGFTISSGEEISDGFERLENKDVLIGQTLVLIDWNRFWSEQYQQHAFTMRILTAQGAKYRIADGSTGIAKQLMEITEARANDPTKFPNGGLLVKDGLRKSEYWVSKQDNRALSAQEAEATPADQKRKAVTYYLNV
jgi:hypothetical protein